MEQHGVGVFNLVILCMPCLCFFIASSASVSRTCSDSANKFSQFLSASSSSNKHLANAFCSLSDNFEAGSKAFSSNVVIICLRCFWIKVKVGLNESETQHKLLTFTESLGFVPQPNLPNYNIMKQGLARLHAIYGIVVCFSIKYAIFSFSDFSISLK